MFKFAIKNLLIKKVQFILIILSILISAGVGVMAFNVSNQVSDGLVSNAQYYSLIIGPSGSATQLAMNSMYFTDEPLGTIPYSVKEQLEMDSRVKSVIPFAMADNYNGYSMVGTTPEYLEGKNVAKGEMFDEGEVFEVVVGSTVARVNDLKIGDSIYTSHGIGDEHHTPFVVKGILEQSHSSFDTVVFTQLRSIWEIHEEHDHDHEHEDEDHDHEHEHEDEEDEHEHEEGSENEGIPGHDLPTNDHDHEDHDHEEMEDRVCSLLIRTTNPMTATQLKNEYNGKIITEDGNSFSLQAIEPMAVMRNVLKDTDQTSYIVYALAGIILLMNILVIIIITLLNMHQSKKDIKLMRLIGISMKKVNLLYLIQNAIVGLVAVILAFGLSRLGLLAMGGYALSMGVVLDLGKVYAPEFLVLLLIFVVNVLPTFICTNVMSRKDGLE